MNIDMSQVRFAAIFILLVAGNAAQVGAISGTAVDVNGKAVPGATIFAFPDDGSAHLNAVPTGESDEKGNFEIRNLAPGLYRIETMKDADAYPRTYSDFYRSRTALVVTVTADKPFTFVTVRMGPKAAIILGSLADGDTGEPIVGRARVWRFSDPGKFVVIALRSSFRILLPPGEDLGFEILADGHDAWNAPESPFRLMSGSTKTIEVRLRKSRPSK